MERNNIAFQYGIHRSPSASNDGELAECVNLEAHNGELTPSVMPEVAFTLEDGVKLLFVHKSGNYKNYIIQRGTELCWFPDKDKQSVTEIGNITPTSIHSVGNTLVILSENNMEYILFKSGYYKRIGNKPPFCCISFGLKNRPIHNNQYSNMIHTNPIQLPYEDFPDLEHQANSYINGDLDSFHYDYERSYTDYNEENDRAANVVNKFTEYVQAELNPLRNACRKKGLFYDSFFVRYAYRMYDGCHYMHSAPIFMPINTCGPIIATRFEKTSDGSFKAYVGMNACMLDYKICGFYNETGRVVEETLLDWEDIIEGLDIFISKQIPRFNEDGKVWGITSKETLPTEICFTAATTMHNSTEAVEYTSRTYSQQYGTLFFDRKGKYSTFNCELKDKDDYQDEINNTSLFYKIYSLNTIKSIIDAVSTERLNLHIKDNILLDLEQQDALEDDFDSHNTIIPSFAHIYNGRLNISGIRTKLFPGFPMESMVPYTYDPDETNYTWTLNTKLEINGRLIDVVSKSHIKLHEKPAFIYYPSTNVKEFSLYMYDDSQEVTSSFSATHQAEAHKLLNGSFYLSPSLGLDDTYTLDLSAANPQPSGDPYISYPNKLYTSEVNNPFYFPLSGRNSVGTGEIIGITSNTQAISPGQFGEYPLIVFSSDGVWALQTGEEGLYYSIHPISKDICTNPNILQTDGPVLFATENGLHSIVGSEIENISKHIKGKPEIVTIPSWDASFDLLATTATDDETFNSFIQDASFAYDYANSRVLIFKDGKSFAYVLSAESGTISKLVLLNNGNAVNLASAINAYPEVLMQSGKDVYAFVPDKDITEATLSKGYIITRPLSFSDPLAMKVINDVRLIYHRSTPESKCRYAMFVSNDGHHWAVRNSLRGHSFKFFRFAIFTELADTDALQGMSVMFDFRRTNKLR